MGCCPEMDNILHPQITSLFLTALSRKENIMTYVITTRKEIRKILNQNIGNIVANQDFSKPFLLGGYIPVLMERGILERVGRGQYKILKKASTPKRKQPVESTRSTKFKSSRKDIRKSLNRNVGNIVTTQDFTIPAVAANYMATLMQKGFLERVGFGKYKVLKRVILKRRGGLKKGHTISKLKDLSAIPAILNSSDEGLIMRQVYESYQRITPHDQQVNHLYLYRLFEFAKNKGVIKDNGPNHELRKTKKGPAPRKILLINKNITLHEWEDLVDKYRMWYQYKKENKVKRIAKRKSVMSKFKCCDSIIDNFGETRDNPNKQYIEDFFIKKVKTRLGNELVRCLVITGPDYNHHINSLFTTFAEKVLVCEIAPDVFDNIYRKAQICPYHINHKVSLLKCDVDDIAAVNCRYSDIDLMRTLKNNYGIIYRQIQRQDMLCKKSKEKFLTFTCTRRCQNSFETTITYLKKLVGECFGMKLTGLSDGVEVRHQNEKLKSCKQIFPLIEKYGRVKKMYVFTYQDDVPMMNVLFSYK